ncbi:MAG: hypothetical protein LBN26_02955 [Christensenellaceae bacterium]|nr:hypothetical protein [Christensenellaceae bacterium]
MMNTLFTLYVGLIPIVPLIGAEIFKRRQNAARRNLCYGLFALQLLLSIACIAAYHRMG